MYNVERLDIGLTNNCNAKCPQCARTDPKTFKKYEWLPLDELYIEDIKKILPAEQLRKITSISLCGTYGDPLVAKDIFQILEYFFSCRPNLYLTIHTNGSMRNNKWWYKLCSILKNKNVTIIFGIDGIDQESHSKYRINTSFEKILDHANIAKMHRIKIEWQFLMFDYNKNLLERAEKLSKQLNFDRFFTIITDRPDVEGDFKIPDGLKPNGREEHNHLEDEVSFIDCLSKNNKEVRISASGLISPCCYLDHLFTSYQHFDQAMKIGSNFKSIPIKVIDKCKDDVEKMFEDNSWHELDGKKHSLEGVLKSSWFDKLLKMHDNLEPFRCFNVCGKKT
jgi:MoaA/NifB/PqqE/SkfB family radical SAM enzyme